MKKDGFTLIELMVAISIIAILSTIGVTTYQGIQLKARDSVRKGDLNNLSTALEIYFQKNGKYVVDDSNGSDLTSCQTVPAESKFYNSIKNNMSDGSVPTDPVSKQAYCYISQNRGQSYRLFTKLEKCQASGGNLCGQNYNYSVYSDDLNLAAAPSE